jgi:hypothetical protein
MGRPYPVGQRAGEQAAEGGFPDARLAATHSS